MDLPITETTMEIYRNTKQLTSYVFLGRQMMNQTNGTDSWQLWIAQRVDE